MFPSLRALAVCLLRGFAPIGLLSLLLVSFAPAGSAQAKQSHRSFWVVLGGWQRLHYTRLAHTTNLDIYARPLDHVSDRYVTSLVRAYERRILPTDLSLFGAPRHLGSVSVLFVPFGGLMSGYFDPNDLITSAGNRSHSNHGNVLYIRLPGTFADPNQSAALQEVVAHELQHLIEYRVRVLDHGYLSEPDWLNEGLSFFAQLANGYWTSRDELKLQASLADPRWPITSLSEGPAFLRLHGRVSYGRAGTFLTYLAGRYGTGLTRSIIASPAGGLPAINRFIHRYHRIDNVRSAFADWSIAQFLGSTGKYGYGVYAAHLTEQPALAIPQVSDFPFDSCRLAGDPLVLPPWGQLFLGFSPPPSGAVLFNVDSPVRGLEVAAIAQNSDQPGESRVTWLHRRHGGPFAYSLSGGSYDRVTLAVSYPGPMRAGTVVPPAHLRVRAGVDGLRRPR